MGIMLIVDRSITASDGRIVIAVFNGELTVKRFNLQAVLRNSTRRTRNTHRLHFTKVIGVSIWGVVTNDSFIRLMIALVDCNNFYASCERVFSPNLWQGVCAF